jgi:para-nitrobenzyl esterase
MPPASKRLLLASACVLVVSKIASATIPEPVQTDTGFVAGTSTSSRDVRVFKGIPFATAPVGRLRWRAPRAPNFRENVLKADHFGLRCMQVGTTSAADAMGEDCLYLNVWTSATNTGGRQPVMVWLHGGALAGGAGSLPAYDGVALAKKGAVVVTLNYRLGPFGWLAHPDLSKESGRNASGDYGLMDVIAALQWVQANILGFGGDPRRVTVFGESAGANLTAALVGSPMAKDLFQRVIAQSSGWMGVTAAPMVSLAQAEEDGRKVAAAMGGGSLDALRAKSAEEVLKAGASAPRTWQVIVDGRYIPEDLSVTFAQGKQNAVDVLVGSNKDEGTFPFFGLPSGNAQQFMANARARFGDLADTFLKLYPARTDAEARTSQLAAFRDELSWQMRLWAELQAKLGRPKAYVFYFIHEPPAAQGQQDLGATHTAEIQYAFSTPLPGRVWTDADRRLAETMSSYWVNFAMNGDPNAGGLPVWPAFHEKTTSQAMVLDERTEPEAKPDAPRLSVYDALWARQKPN